MTGRDPLDDLTRADPARDRRPAVPPPGLLRAVMAEPAVGPVRRRRSRPMLRVAPFGVVAIAAVLVATTLARPASAFATWTPAPGTVDHAFADAMQENCAVGPPIDRSGMDPATRAEVEAEELLMASLPLVAMDQRGDAGVAFFAAQTDDGHATALCMFADRGEEALPTTIGGGWSAGAHELPADGPLRLLLSLRDRSDEGVYTVYAGSADAAVAAVSVQRSSGEPVTATVADGYFLVWWPGDAYATGFTAHDAAGATFAEIGNAGWDFLEE